MILVSVFINLFNKHLWGPFYVQVKFYGDDQDKKVPIHEYNYIQVGEIDNNQHRSQHKYNGEI